MVIRSQKGLDRVFHALADPTRRRIVEKLTRAEHGVMELAAEFEMSQPAVTKHLNVLQKAGIIARHKEGRRRVCRLKPRALERSARWIESCRDFWNARLDALEELLAEPGLTEESGDVDT